MTENRNYCRRKVEGRLWIRPRLLAAINLGTVLFILIGAFMLRANGHLTEEHFVEMIKLTLMLNLSIAGVPEKKR